MKHFLSTLHSILLKILKINSLEAREDNLESRIKIIGRDLLNILLYHSPEERDQFIDFINVVVFKDECTKRGIFCLVLFLNTGPRVSPAGK